MRDLNRPSETLSLVLLGAGGHASDVMTVVEAIVDRSGEPYDIAMADDRWSSDSRFRNRLPYERFDSIDSRALGRPFVASVGYPDSRRRIAELAEQLGGLPATPLIHPGCELGAKSEVGDGSVIMGTTWISANASIGRHVYVGYGVTIGHDCRIGDFTSLMPGATISGEVQLGAAVLVGANATVLQGLTVGEGASIGAGAVVTTDVAAGTTVVGVPARPVTQE